MAPRKKPRARPVPVRTKPNPAPARSHVVTVGGLDAIPPAMRESMLLELLALQNGAQRIVPPPSAGATVAAETRGQALIARTTRLLDDLNNNMNTIENAVRKLGGSWPWPEPLTPNVAGEIVDVDNFQGMLDSRLDRLQGNVRHAGIVAERLRDIA